MRAVRGTTGIEGTELTEQEVAQILDLSEGEHALPDNRRREELEAINAEKVMRFVATSSHDSVTEGLTREIHKLTTDGIDYARNIPGEYRNHTVRAGTYIPPKTGEEVRRLMAEFVSWFNQGLPMSWDPIIRSLVAHFFVISIHPFGDGNGRTSRGIESFVLYRGGINVRGFYSLANYYYQYRDEYVRLLDHVRFETNGDLTPYVRFALRGLESELEVVHEEIISHVRLIAFRDFARETLLDAGAMGTRRGERMFHFLLALGAEQVPISELRSREHPLARLYRHVSTKTLLRDIEFLLDHELIVVGDKDITPNLEIMTRYIPPAPAPGRRVRGRPGGRVVGGSRPKRKAPRAGITTSNRLASSSPRHSTSRR